MRRFSLCLALVFSLFVGLAQAGEPCPDAKCTPPPAVVVSIPQPMPGPPAPKNPSVTVRVNANRGPVARVFVAIFGRGSGTTVTVR